ncbi:MAG TPA: isoprenylcysteine carboxylmethyltransferase family protein [Vicinamibacterales bacterium]|nr:isoprenylcysteine carboxylmethyltransferase family protein [Vicinamibacterales bacterium]
MADKNPGERGARVRFPPPLVFVAGLLAGVAIDRFVAAAPVPIDRSIRIAAGVIVALLGVALLVSSRLHFVRTGQSVIPWTPTPELIFQGPYRFTRNPMYVGMTLLLIGLGVAFNNLWMSAFALPALLVVHMIAVLPEEKYLSEKFGDGYRTYLARVRRYL